MWKGFNRHINQSNKCHPLVLANLIDLRSLFKTRGFQQAATAYNETCMLAVMFYHMAFVNKLLFETSTALLKKGNVNEPKETVSTADWIQELSITVIL